MKPGAPEPFGTQLRTLREAAGFTQEELATVAGLSVHAISALERGQRRRPHVDTLRALSSALDLTGSVRDALIGSARAPIRLEPITEGISTLPVPLTALVGREHDVATLHRMLTDGAARLITLLGPGGVGKTRLALEVARDIARGATRVVFVPLTVAPSAAFVGSTIAEAFDISNVAPSELPKRISLACRDRTTLLVLDNFEHVLEAVPLVIELLAAAQSIQLLVTSRAPLRIRGEREYVVGPLALDRSIDETSVDDASVAPAERLLIDRIRDVVPAFQMTRANRSSVTAICRRLDALPLALELVAPWMKTLTPDNLRERLDQDVLLSAFGRRDLPERQQTMNATVAWSYRLLDADEQRAFRRLGALPGLFPIDAAAAVLAGGDTATDRTGDALTAVATLIDKSLVLRPQPSVVPTCALYRMLETVRAYAALQLAESGERDEAMEGLVQYCLGEARLAAAGLGSTEQVEWLDRVREDLESYRSALAWLIEHHRADDAASIASSLLFFWVIRGHALEGLRWFEEILRLPALSPATEATALSGASLMWFTQGDLGRARETCHQSLALSRRIGATDIVALALDVLGHVEHGAGELERARALLIESVDTYRALGTSWGIGNALTGAAGVLVEMGEIVEAERLLDEATDALRDAGPWFHCLKLYVHSTVAVRSGQPDKAMRIGHESLSHIQELQDKFALIYALVPLAIAAASTHDDEWAARILGARDAVSERTGATVVHATTRDMLLKAARGVRDRLGEEAWAREYSAGRRSSIGTLLSEVGERLG